MMDHLRNPIGATQASAGRLTIAMALSSAILIASATFAPQAAAQSNRSKSPDQLMLPKKRVLPDRIETPDKPDADEISDMLEAPPEPIRVPDRAPAREPAAGLAPEQAAKRVVEPSPSLQMPPTVNASVTESEPVPYLAPRSMAEIAEQAEIATPITENSWVMDGVIFPDTTMAPPEPVVDEHGFERISVEHYSDADHRSLFWSQAMDCQALPPGLLWTPPLANQREPRMYGKFTNLNDESTIETAIGGEFGLVRFAPQGKPGEGIQIDAFAGVFTRFNEQRLLVTSDFRVGVPVTYAKGPWQAKIGYEHTSTHLGDEYIHATGAVQVPHVRDEIVFGLARRFFNEIRVYGQFGYSFMTSNVVGENRDRYDWGVEWSRNCPTGKKGQPFAAFDMDLRSDQDFQPNTTVQVGWQWNRPLMLNYSMRIALEYYNGKSPYGQFFQDDESWVGFAGFYDW